MGCKVETKDGMEKVTFLYRLVDGPCPKSYGVNVARIAGNLVSATSHTCRSETPVDCIVFLTLVGMPERILKRAITKSAEIEQLENTRVLKHYEEKLFLEASKLAKKLFTCNQQDLAPFHNILEEWRRMHPLLPAK
jgi:DNA mismatch repair ATPase MutS